MLKQLIQLFAEKFLTSKKEWIAGFSNCNWTGYTQINISALPTFEENPMYKIYLPPSDGVITFTGSSEDNYMDIQPQAVFGLKARGLNSIIVPVRKGKTVFVYNADLNGLRFVPFLS